MRFVIFGAGAIGGLIGARLHQAGCEVVLIARGANLERIESRGLTLTTPVERVTLRIPVVRTAAQAKLRNDDVILLCTKSQHTLEALLSIRDAVVDPWGELEVPVVCMQNGVANERAALRFFSQTYGAVVVIPAEHLEPGCVISYAGRLAGSIDIGVYPGGADARARAITAALHEAGFESSIREDIMVHKYAKLLSNLGNGIQVICGRADPAGNEELGELAMQEGRAVLTAAGIAHDISEVVDVAARWVRLGVGEVDGHRHRGSSSWQSLARGTGDVETDYLNGEIVVVGRTIGVPTPYNSVIQTLAHATVRDGRSPGWRTPRSVIVQASMLR